MRTSLTRRAAGLTLVAALAVTGAACSPPSSESSTSSSDSGASVDAATATSAEDFGGMDALVEAAKAEGELNVIALPPDWANYGGIISAFEDKYGITINSAQPDASSADEIAAADRLKGQSSAPDVFDLGASVASANTDKFAPYTVETFGDIPDNLKASDGTWVNDYGGYMSVGYDPTKVPAPTSLADLLGPDYQGKVALNGDPTKAGAAFAAVQMASVANGGTVEDVAPGVDYFAKLKSAGNLIPVDPTPATIESGQTPVVFDWDYLNAGQASKMQGTMEWRIFVPSDAVVGGYYVQAISKDAPHPAAARLWQEFLYSDEGQNLWLEGGARPVRMEAMTTAGTIDEALANALPQVTGDPVIPTEDQNTKAKEYLATSWANAVG
ncbi:MAG: ABC transporter substrate-binding protein [Actinomycetales bacterium]